MRLCTRGIVNALMLHRPSRAACGGCGLKVLTPSSAFKTPFKPVLHVAEVLTNLHALYTSPPCDRVALVVGDMS